MCAKCEEQERASKERGDLFAIVLDGGRLAVHVTAAGLVKVDVEDQKTLEAALAFVAQVDAEAAEGIRRLQTRTAYCHMVAGAILSKVREPLSAPSSIPNVPPSRGLN